MTTRNDLFSVPLYRYLYSLGKTVKLRHYVASSSNQSPAGTMCRGFPTNGFDFDFAKGA